MGLAKREQTTEIDGVRYTTRVLPAMEGINILPQLIALVGDKLMPIIFATGGEGLDSLREDPAVIGVILANIAAKAAKRQSLGEDPMKVIKDILVSTRCNKVRLGDVTAEGSVYDHFDEHFAGDYAHMFSVVGWVGGVNFMPASIVKSSTSTPAVEAENSKGSSQ
jgi:hypothetical protein